MHDIESIIVKLRNGRKFVTVRTPCGYCKDCDMARGVVDDCGDICIGIEDFYGKNIVFKEVKDND